MEKNAPFKLEDIVIEKDYIVLSINVNSTIILLVNVYIRSDVWEISTLNQYLEALSNLEMIIESFKFNAIYFIGDFNADPFSGRAWNNLSDFMERNALNCFDKELLNDSSFTFVSYGNGGTRWLDHIVGRDSENVNVQKATIFYNMIGSDHLPLLVNFSVNCVQSYNYSGHIEPTKYVFIGWDKINDHEIKAIDDAIVESLSELQNCETMNCLKRGCRKAAHLDQLRNFYAKLCNSLEFGKSNYMKQLTRKCKYKVIPG